MDHGADVINIRVGGTGGSQSLQSVVGYAYDVSIAHVTISDNDGVNAVRFSGRYLESFTLGATDSTDERTNFSN